jgi:probable HAF family extracellular repeat protein
MTDSMARHTLLCGLVATALSVAVLEGQTTPVASFHGLGQMPGASPSGTYAGGISGDGTTVVGYGWVNGNTTHAFRWTAPAGYEVIGAGTDSRALAASFDGSVVVGQANFRAFRWTHDTGMEELPIYHALDVSADGQALVGMNIRWMSPNFYTDLGFLGDREHTSAYGISADGQVVVGFSERPPHRYVHAFRWTATGGLRDLGVTTGTESLAWGVSADGQVVVGEARSSLGFWRAFRWTASLGMRDLGTLGGPMSTAHGASRDGSVIVGKSLINGITTSLRAFRWTPAGGMRDVRQLLLEAGVMSVQPWILSVAAGVSDDGTVIAGWGFGPNQTWEPWVAVLPVGNTRR